MKCDVFVQDGIIIPEHELEITTSRAGGPGGQHVNKTDSRITIKWNVNTTKALTDEYKTRVLENLKSRLTNEGVIIINNNSSRSQVHNKKAALATLAHVIRKALYVPKKRRPSTIPESIKQARLKEKSQRSLTKKLRSKKIAHDE